MIDLKPLPMEEAQQFWRDKISLSPGQFQRLSDEAKTRAFAVSGIAKGGELSTVFQALQRGIDEGTSFSDFKRDCAGIFEKRGWTGMRAWRVDNIFRTNIQMAYNVGRYRQMMDVRESRPFWRYSAVNDSRTRPTHAALNGKVFPADSPFWDTWYPPNGFRCRCGVVTLSRPEVERDGLTVEQNDPTGKLIEPIDPETGNRMPARLLMPDQGFAHNPGKTVWGGLTPKEGVHGFTDIGLSKYSDYGRRKMDNLPAAAYRPFSDDMLLHAGKEDRFYTDRFLAEFGFKEAGGGVFVDKIGEPLIISDELFRGADGVMKVKKRGRERYLPLLAETVKEPYEIWLVPMKEKRTGRIVLRKRFIRGFSTGSEDKLSGFAAFEYGPDGWNGVTAFRPDELIYADKARNGVLLYPR